MFKYINNRSNLKFQPYLLYDLSKGNKSLLQRMSLLRLLDIHRGCVNTISWDDKGELILSGSDDHNLIISNAFHGTTISQLHTSHRANIFSAKFLPDSNSGKIISCSGNGLILYTDVEYHTDLDRRFSFHCHEGTCFEVLTIPGCSNTFLSCGEDGTVRCIDIRIKSSCFQSNCKEDILLNMGQAVTSMAVNDVKPYNLAASTPDSTIRIYDRRMLGAKSKDSAGSSSDALIMRLIPTSLDGKNRRTTFIDYNSTGTEILASYSAENLYLFDLQDSAEFTPMGVKDEAVYEDDDSCSGPTLKRLRLRGDWSDTGPLAVPESELRYQAEDVGQARPTLLSTWMQRMTDEWLQNPSEVARMASRNTGADVDSNDTDAGVDSNDTEEDTNEDSQRHAENVSVSGSENNDLPTVSIEDSDLGQSGFNHVISCNESVSINDQNNAANMEATSELYVDSSSDNCAVLDDLLSRDEHNTIDERTLDRAPPEQVFSPMQTDADESKDIQMPCNISNNQIGEDAFSSINCSMSSDAETLPSETTFTSCTIETSMPSTSAGGASSQGSDISLDAHGSSQSREPEQVEEQKPRSSASQRMARAIDKVVRSVRKKGARKFDDPVFRKVPYGKEIRQFRGHRNARTIIKEACFWGKDHVMSGSDCGRVFVWEKSTGRLVMLWEADKHVVNCLQPHPTLPVLATCGIDYDVKVWAPICEETRFDDLQSQNIIQRNDAIQAETRDTVTVPAVFMIRMIATLNQIRRQDRARQREANDE